MADTVTYKQERDHYRCEQVRLKAKLDRLTAQNKALVEALEKVEWVNSGNWWFVCPWCMHEKKEGHATNCQRQAALDADRKGE